jgi:hypothetical protein
LPCKTKQNKTKNNKKRTQGWKQRKQGMERDEKKKNKSGEEMSLPNAQLSPVQTLSSRSIHWNIPHLPPQASQTYSKEGSHLPNWPGMPRGEGILSSPQTSLSDQQGG